MAISFFTPTTSVSLVCTDTSQNVTVAGATALVTNVGSAIAYISIAATVTATNQIALVPNASIALAATQISAIGLGAILNIVSGA